MGGLNVKITIVERVLQIIAPHPCYGCGKVGVLLCAYCKYDIKHEPYVGCFVCGEPEKSGICDNHETSLERAFIVSKRADVLQKAIDGLKFSHTKACALVLAELLHESLPLLSPDTQIVPIPTVRSHIRQRGYDQVELIARHFATLRGLSVARAIQRVGVATQHTADRATRQVQSREAFAFIPNTLNGGPVLLLDDIVTTGSTLLAAAEVLKDVRAPLWAAALAYQPLD